jgi:hypothetical protein
MTTVKVNHPRRRREEEAEARRIGMMSGFVFQAGK